MCIIKYYLLFVLYILYSFLKNKKNVILIFLYALLCTYDMFSWLVKI
ncbi:MAG: hypothetical protein H6Q12_497 [Bacteroidetes bacterium]|nr:hypothetical protein [Bacteroidota bacterium]